MDEENATLLRLVISTLKFATDHPYAATGILGAAVGSTVTYKVLTLNPKGRSVRETFTPKIYELALSPEHLRELQENPDTELRWDMANISVVVTTEKREPLRQLPDIEQ